MAEKFTVAYWLERAEEARTIADDMRDPEARRVMLDVAARYEWIAERTEKLAGGRTGDQISAPDISPSRS